MGAGCTRSTTISSINSKKHSTKNDHSTKVRPQILAAEQSPMELNENFEDFTVIWLDAAIDTSPDCINTKQHL